MNRRLRAAWTSVSVLASGPVLLVAVAAVATFSVAIYDVRIVATYTAAALLLAMSLARGATGLGRARRGVAPIAFALALAGYLTLTVHAFTYLASTPAATVRLVSAGAAVAAAALIAVPTARTADAALLVAVLGYVVSAALLIHLDPTPRIDVWYTLQGAADGLVRGQDMYSQVWVGPPGTMAAFTYLPWTAVVLAPGRWLAGDVRWALVAATLAGALLMRAVPGRRRTLAQRRATSGLAALLLVLPGTSTQVEQAWTEPLLLACLAGFALAVSRRRMGWAVVLLALGLASKQHLALLLPVLAAWPRFGLRRAGVATGLAAALVLPWVIADPGAMVHDTVTFLVRFPPIRFADTLVLASIHELGWSPPFWLTGAVVAGTLGLVCLVVRRRNRGLGEVLRWCALVLLVANLDNKQAFYNQFWLVGALLVLSWAHEPEAPASRPAGGAELSPREGRPAAAAA